jgi:cysteinyl-tRNA synthetase
VELALYNTLTKSTEPLPRPEEGAPVGLYTCGPTVYNYLHIGNYRTYVFEDVLKRTLKLLGYPVRHVMNITDVGHLVGDGDEGEDKMSVTAKRENKTAWDIAKFYTETFLSDAKKLRLDFSPAENPKRENDGAPIDVLCKATEHIREQMAQVDALAEKGFTYETADGIYFDTSKFPDYGALAGGAHLSGLQEGQRVSMGEKKNRTDFAVWKFSPEGEKRQMEWEYRGRMGFPGWHIECSAMGQTYLGDTFDLHCGGVDHIPIHHANEIAQAEAATGKKPFVKFWLHGEFLVLNKAKMAKSAGGFITLGDLEKKGFDALDYRYFCYSAHYRRQLEFSWESLEAAKTARARLAEKARAFAEPKPGDASREWMEKFAAALADDLNAPEALAVVHTALSKISEAGEAAAFLKEADAVLSLGLFERKAEAPLESGLQERFDAYVAARAAKDYATSDRLRKELADSGVVVKDSKEGSSWVRK